MTLPPGLIAADKAGAARPLHLLDRDTLPGWLEQQDDQVRQWVQAHAFDAAPASWLTLPRQGEAEPGAILGLGDRHDPFSYAHAPFALPAGAWQPAQAPDAEAAAALALGWGIGSYRFDRYRKAPRAPAQLAIDADEDTVALIEACRRVRDLVNTPTQDMGPDELETAARGLAETHGGQLESIAGDELLRQNFPAIHAVGRASHRAPRLLHLTWGKDSDPLLALVGKGVCFDTGGLDIKPADGMRNMKKDMGGAAHALALAGLVMARGLPVRLSVLVPAVENAIGPDAFRPGEVVATRKGVSVEIDNTDAEGRVVLGDALTYAGESSPDLLIDFATLTGAARIALGPDLPALYSNDDAVAEAWLKAGMDQRDPVWRMPLWRPYLRYLTSRVADIANAGSRMAGSVTAALYLERFVPEGTAWAHLDVFAWNDSERPGRPIGGEAQGLRAAWAMLKARYGN